jgi:hypothetical protein
MNPQSKIQNPKLNNPLQPLPPIQRLGWLIHFRDLRCRRSITTFRARRRYPITCETVRVQQRDRRTRRDGVTEPVIYTGQELFIRIKDNAGTWHRCLPTPANQHPLIHDFTFLIDHFDIPEVHDVATLNQKQFAANKRALKALEK